MTGGHVEPDDDPHFEILLRYLKEQRGFDFTGYKRQSLVRRVRRRMTTVGIERFDEYQDHLALHPQEFTELFDTVLINVTDFFRDADAWEFMRTEVVPALLRTQSGTLRVWSAGCAGGQEAYSLAITLAEALGEDEFRGRVKIYATDVDQDALAHARAATYSAAAVQSVPPELLERYFEQSGQGFVIRKELRRAVIFGRNDLVQDAPISHIDLLVCRNTLMYFNAETQARIVRRLHFALKPDGVLFLGKAEMLLSHPELFQPFELKRRYFRKVARIAAEPVTGSGQRMRPAAPDDGSPLGRLREEALQAAPAAQVVITLSGQLAASNRRAEMLFGVGARDIGRPFQDLEVSYRPIELRSHVEHALRECQPVWVREVEWRRPGAEPVWLDVQVVPLLGQSSELLGTTVVFNDVTRHRELQQELESTNRQLEAAYEELQSTNEELETTNEELQSTVEELETTNEELQSTNEELETMNEELQSMNDELNASNEELRLRTLEVDELNHFMEAVLSSLGTGIAVVDAGLTVLAWNPRAEDLWGVRTDEAVGRSLADLDIGLPLAPLRPLVRARFLPDDDGAEAAVDRVVRVQAVNRRGRQVEVDVAVSALRRDGAPPTGAVLVMRVVD
jgi:two-component system, chemotaxis family, CheB/CheR fusion protein